MEQTNSDECGKISIYAVLSYTESVDFHAENIVLWQT